MAQELDHLRDLAIEDRRPGSPIVLDDPTSTNSPIVLDSPDSNASWNGWNPFSQNGTARFKSAVKTAQRLLSALPFGDQPAQVDHHAHTMTTAPHPPPALIVPVDNEVSPLQEDVTRTPHFSREHPVQKRARTVSPLRLRLRTEVERSPSPPPVPPKHSLIVELPHQVLLNIFLHCRDDNPMAPWLLSTVSSRWRKICVAPGLWSRIHLVSAPQRSIETTKIWLSRSKKAPRITVTFVILDRDNWPRTMVDELFQLVWRQLPRIREFEFVTSQQDYTIIAGEWLRGHARALERLCVAYKPTWGNEQPTDVQLHNVSLALGAPRLVDVVFDAACITWSSLQLHGLKRLSLSTSEAHTDICLVRDILANCPELRFLSLSMPHIHSSDETPRVTCPHLHEFQVGGTGNAQMALDCVDAPHLRALVLSDADGPTLLPSLELAEHLPWVSLRALTLRNVRNLPVDFASRLGGFPRLKHLTIDNSTFYPSTSFTDEMETRRADPDDAMFPRLGVLTLENIEWIDEIGIQRLLDSRASWTKLRRINVMQCSGFGRPNRTFVASGPSSD